LVKVRLLLDRQGNVLIREIISHSDYDLLDRAALASIDRVENFGRVPKGIEKKEIEVIVPINYELI